MKTINKEEFAKMLNNRKYRDEITTDECMQAKENNLVVLFGASDDLAEFRGVIDDELGAWDGESFKIKKKKKKVKALGMENIGHAKELNLGENIIHQIWCPVKLGCSWSFESDIPHAKFDIYEDSDLYQVGIVFNYNDLK